MLFQETKLAGAFVIEIERRADERGFFARTFCEREFASHGLPTRFPQCNLSRNRQAGTLRGMHYQAAPYRESKLVRCGAGAIYDVIVDLRAVSPTRLEWVGVELTAESGRALFVPEGFAHGFLTLARRHRCLLPDGRVLRAGRVARLSWNDPTLDIRLAAAAGGDHRARRVVPRFRSRQCSMAEGRRRAKRHSADAMFALVEELYPICRSITGDGLRETLRILSRHAPLALTEVQTGTAVLDWTVPREWNIRDAWIENAKRRARRRLSRLQPARRELQRARARADVARRAAPASAHRSPIAPISSPTAPPTTTMPGVSVSRSASSSVARGRVRGLHRFHAGAGILTYGELVMPGRERRRDPDLDARLPPVALRRQPERASRSRSSWPARFPQAPRQAHVEVSLRSRHHRRDHLAGAKPRARAAASSTVLR